MNTMSHPRLKIPLSPNNNRNRNEGNCRDYSRLRLKEIPIQNTNIESNNKIDFYNTSEYFQVCQSENELNMNDINNDEFINCFTESDEDVTITNRNSNLVDDSDEIKQRISHLMRKTRMNTLKRK